MTTTPRPGYHHGSAQQEEEGHAVTVVRCDQLDTFECPGCGNKSSGDGFTSCIIETGDLQGLVVQVEPTAEGPWDGLYQCEVCGALNRVTGAEGPLATVW